ncbi:hypothetical protein Ciccas_011618 [Cichlidogyrus casuarinus]|uniref:Uncharacterized protein n=1 Tax=Cichlidogyrus casuarinus TaxID=1844966 RepID=A0ABD2PS16_9PLAT
MLADTNVDVRLKAAHRIVRLLSKAQSPSPRQLSLGPKGDFKVSAPAKSYQELAGKIFDKERDCGIYVTPPPIIQDIPDEILLEKIEEGPLLFKEVPCQLREQYRGQPKLLKDQLQIEKEHKY